MFYYPSDDYPYRPELLERYTSYDSHGFSEADSYDAARNFHYTDRFNRSKSAGNAPDRKARFNERTREYEGPTFNEEYYKWNPSTWTQTMIDEHKEYKDLEDSARKQKKPYMAGYHADQYGQHLPGMSRQWTEDAQE